MESITLQANGFGCEIRKERSLHLDGRWKIYHY
jgi:hypothetical protein